MSSKKLTLLDIRCQQHFDISALAVKAGVDPHIVHAMLTYQPVQRFLAELVLAALSDETDEEYTLDTVDVVLLLEEGKEESS
ncbi:MAG TPA: hypothetical protein VFB12_29930 [Ktedonobacteraceae bacterium]|nr:hypothetical protein [Ktedonobacteraceae bacterium]